MRTRLAVASGLVALATSATAGLTVTTPGRTQTRAGRITAISLTHASVAFVVGETPAECDHVELWNTDAKGMWRFGKPTTEPCKEHPSTGSGIAQIAAATDRVLWVSYVGGNNRDWILWTATPTSKTPKQLRFVERDVEAPPPIVIGEGMADAIPYAVDTQLVALRDNGKALFKWTAPSAIRAVSAGNGAGGARFAAVLATGSVELLSNDGAVVKTYSYPAGAVRALALAPGGLLVQVGANVEIRKGATPAKTVALAAKATVLDYAQGRILYSLAGSIYALQVSSGQDSLLVQGTPTQPALATLDSHGFAWATGNSVNWNCAVCISF